MAAKSTVRVAITNNAAKDDSFSGSSLEWLSENGSLVGRLNVLGNDPGSATLYGVSTTMPSGTGTILREAAGSTDSFTVDSGYGNFTGELKLNADGTVGFDLSSMAGKIDALAQGESISVTFYYTAQMANGVLSVAKVTVEITGENDVPKALAEHVNVFEGGAIVTDHLDATDADHNAQLNYALVGTAPAGFELAADGSYSFDPSVSAYDHLPAGVSQVINVDYTVTDEFGAASTATITITVEGTNDPAVITGNASGTVVEDTELTASGKLDVADVDDGQAAFRPLTDAAGTCGALSIDADGNWSYTLDHDKANALQGGEPQTDSFTVKSVDGTEHVINVNVTGTNDAPTFGGVSIGDVVEDVSTTISGQATVSDPDHDESHFVAQTDAAGTFGALSIDADGNWSYTLDHDKANALQGGEPQTDSFTVKSVDGTEHVISVNVTGTNDAPTFGGVSTGSVTEDATVNTVSGQATVSDPDHDQSHFVAKSGLDSLNGTYGTLSIDANGYWNYTLDNDRAATNALNTGTTGHDVFTVTSTDGSTHQISVDVNGHTDFTYVTPPVSTGAADPNDFDSSGRAGVQNPADFAADKFANVLYGGAGDDNINGLGGTDRIYGGSGNDVINGGDDNDVLFGGSGNDDIRGNNDADVIYGGFGADTLTGNNGADTFVYRDARDTGDTITDFAQNSDRIDLSAFAPNVFLSAALTDAGAVGANEIGWMTSGGVTKVYVDTDGHYGADLEISLTGTVNLTAADFILA